MAHPAQAHFPTPLAVSPKTPSCSCQANSSSSPAWCPRGLGLGQSSPRPRRRVGGRDGLEAPGSRRPRRAFRRLGPGGGGERRGGDHEAPQRQARVPPRRAPQRPRVPPRQRPRHRQGSSRFARPALYLDRDGEGGLVISWGVLAWLESRDYLFCLQAAASMNVSVGYFCDPEGLEGLAHFLGEFFLLRAVA